MAGHYHHNDASLTQNQGNHVGDRPCVRQSRTYRAHNGGNAMKDIMGQGNLAWDTENMQGAYAGAAHPGHCDDGAAPTHGHQSTNQQNYQQPPPQQQQQRPPQQQSEPHWSHHQEQQPSAPRAQPAQQQAHWSHHQEQQQGAAQPSAHRGRPGAGAANRTTYNFMTGQ